MPYLHSLVRYARNPKSAVVLPPRPEVGGLIGKATAEKDGLLPKEQFCDSKNISTTPLNSLIVEGKHVLSVQKTYWEEAGISFLPSGYGIIEVVKPYSGSYIKQSIIIGSASYPDKVWVAERFSSDKGVSWRSVLISGDSL